MTNENSNADSSFSDDRHPQPDVRCQATLVESLIHSFLDNGALTKDQALEAVRSELQVKEESASAEKEPARVLRKSLGLLVSMQQSIEAHSGRYDQAAQAGPQEDQRG